MNKEEMMYEALLCMYKLMKGNDPITEMKLDRCMEKLEDAFTPVTVTAEMVRSLRTLTGYDIVSCKQALIECKGLQFEASEWLRNNR